MKAYPHVTPPPALTNPLPLGEGGVRVLALSPLTRHRVAMPTSPKGRGATTGFTLIELAIVIVIIGLLAGGVLVGRDMIRAAELRSITTDYQLYTSAIEQFNQKYLALPGDIKNATAFWGAAHATPATCITTVGTGTQTCNGDGNFRVDEATNEMFRFWQHLANAGLISGSYTGVTGSGGVYHAIPNTNSPVSKLQAATWFYRHLTPISGSSAWYDDNYENHFFFGGTGNNFPANSILTPIEAFEIDTKIDDGLSGRGSVMAYSPAGWNNAGGTLERCTLSTSSSDKDKSFALSKSGINCALVFKDR